MTSRTRCAAFFDVDGTITREGLISELFRKMVRYELIDETKWQFEVKPAFTRWNRRVGDYDHYLQKMVDVYLDTVKNTDSKLIGHIARKVVEQNYERVYTYTRDKLRWHQKQGHKVIAISGSPIELVREMAERYRMDDYKATVYEVGDDGFYSGHIIPMWDSRSKRAAVLEMAERYRMDDYKATVYEVGEDGYYSGHIIPMWDSRSKRAAVLEMAEKYDLDLNACFAYGDTAGDYTMLDMVGNPFAINPTRELLSKISENGELRGRVSIIVERKDATYELDVNCINLI